MWIEDPDGIRIVPVEVPAGYPLRRDRHRHDRQGDEPYAADADSRPGMAMYKYAEQTIIQ
jgi:hypothetical protein